MASETFIVTSSADSGAGSLRDAITQAENAFGVSLDESAGDFASIVFADGMDGELIRLSSELTISGTVDIRIDGDIDDDGTIDVTVSGDTNANGIADAGDSELLYIGSSATVSIENLKFTDGFADSTSFDGASVIVNLGDTALTNVEVTDSYVVGANYYDSYTQLASTMVNDGALQLSDVVFEDNKTVGGDGSVDYNGYYGQGGNATSGILNTGDLSFDRVSFRGEATGGQGGLLQDGGNAFIGIYNDGDVAANVFPSLIGQEGLTGLTAGAGGEGGEDGFTDSGLIFGAGGESTGSIVEVGSATTGDDIIDRSANFGGRFLALGGDDEIIAGEGEQIFGGAGDDLLIMTGGTGGEATTIQGDNGSDTIVVAGSDFAVIGGGGEGKSDLGIDTVSFENIDEGVTVDLSVFRQDFIEGSEFTQEQIESMTGTDHADMLSGNDFFAGGLIKGGEGGDILMSGDLGTDLEGGRGKDLMYGSAVNDLIKGGKGNDSIYGFTGEDELSGDFGADFISGGSGKDEIEGGDGKDDLNGGDGDDTMDGGIGNDKIAGNSGGDKLVGGRGNDDMSGGKGADDLVGGRGKDTLSGDKGKDELTGGRGADDFVFAAGFSRDIVTDFDRGQNDEIVIDDNLFSGNKSAQQIVNQFGTTYRGDAALDFGDGDMIVFEGFDDIDLLVDFIDIA